MPSNRGSVYPKMHQMQPFEANSFKISQGSMPPDPPSVQGAPALVTDSKGLSCLLL